MKFQAFILTVIPFFALSCAKKTKLEAHQEPVAPVMQAPIAVEAKPTVQDTKIRIQDLLTEAFKPVYFPYDQAELPEKSKDLLARAGGLLKQAPSVTVLIEGNADERGTEEYNMALGEKRAASVMQYLIHYGIEASRLKIISYGEEKPSTLGHGESDWAQNRRDEFKVSLNGNE